jgi:ribosome-associated protein
VTDSNPSKSARKLEQLERQALGERLIELSDAELASLALEERLADAVRNARTMTSHGALRRQKQLIGKLMRNVDPEPVRAQLQALRSDDRREKRIFARAEKWRDRIVRDRQAGLDAFETETGQPDPVLRQLLVELDVAISDRDETTVRRNIFRRIHTILGRISQ